jgi:hypothetical protein
MKSLKVLHGGFVPITAHVSNTGDSMFLKKAQQEKKNQEAL